MNRKETTMHIETKHTIELREHELIVDETTYTHNNEEIMSTMVKITSNDRKDRSVIVQIDDDGRIAVFVSGLSVGAGNIRKQTRSLHGNKYVVLSSKNYNDNDLDKIFINV